MAYSAKLMNPTPWDVELNYEKGVVLVVPAFGSVDLTMQQLDDYRPDKPGSEAVYEELDFHGLFLMDSDRPYDNQALEAIEKSLRKKRELYNSKLQTHRDRAARQGINVDEDTINNLMRQMGMFQLDEKIQSLRKLSEQYGNVVEDENARRRHKLDPERTVFAMSPPREFPSTTARKFFLEQNPEIAAKEAEFRAALEDAEAEEAA